MKLAVTLMYLLAFSLLSGLSYFTTDAPSDPNGVAVGAQEKQTLPGKLVLDDPEKKMSEFAGDRGKTPFDHEQHVGKDTCVTCHHTNSEKLTKAMEEAVPKCTACHKADDGPAPIEGTREGMTFKGKTAINAKDAYHGNDSIVGCIGCHKERSISPTRCAECHSGS